MKALTAQQPWAWAIFHGKNVENRTQLWGYRGTLLIHAGLRWSERGAVDDRVVGKFVDERSRNGLLDDVTEMVEDFELSKSDVGPVGAVLGTVELVDVHPAAGCCAPWGESAYVEHGVGGRRRVTHLVLEDPRLLPVPIPCVGALGLWTPPVDVVDAVTAARRRGNTVPTSRVASVAAGSCAR